MNTPNPLAELVAKELEARKADGWSKEPLPPKLHPPIVREPRDPAQDRAKLGAIIVNLYLLKKRDHTAIEISTRTTFSLNEVNALLKGELPEGVTSVMRKRGKERVRVYGPTREHLRDLLIKAEQGRTA